MVEHARVIRDHKRSYRTKTQKSAFNPRNTQPTELTFRTNAKRTPVKPVHSQKAATSHPSAGARYRGLAR